MNKLIVIRSVQIKSGTGRNGKPYELTIIKAENNDEYAGFTNLMLSSGMAVDIEAEPNPKKQGSFKFKSLRVHNGTQVFKPNANPVANQEKRNEEEAHTPYLAYPAPLSDIQILEAWDRAKKEADNLLSQDTGAYWNVVCLNFQACLQQQAQAFSVQITKRIQADKLSNMGMIQ